MFEKFEFSTKIIIKEAQKQGIEVSEIHAGQVACLKKGAKEIYFYRQLASISTSVANIASKNKEIAKSFLSLGGIKTPEGYNLLSSTSFEQVSDCFSKLGGNVALKPSTGSKGVGVCLNVNNSTDLKTKWENAAKVNEKIILEKMISGLEYRFFATRTKVCAVTLRVPANVVGNGKDTVKALVERKNIGRGSEEEKNSPLFRINIDENILGILNKAGKGIDYIPQDGEKVFLRETSNLSAGGDPIDMTDKMPDFYKNIAVKAVNSIPGLAYAGVDMIISDIENNSEDNYSVIEINSSPGIAMHHFPYEGTSRNVAAEILKICFMENNDESR